VTVASNEYRHLRSALFDIADQMLQHGSGLHPAGPFAGPENGSEQFAASNLIDMKRLKTVLIIVSVKQAHLLGSVGWTIGIIHIQDYLLRWLAV